MATKLADITLNKKNDNVLTLKTKKKYTPDDVYFNIAVIPGEVSSGTATADVDVNSISSSSINSTNISDSIGEKSSSEPISGYYICMDASGSATPAVTTSGWVNEGSLPTVSATATKYFPITAATITQNAPTINSSTGLVTATSTITAGYTPADTKSNTFQLATKGAETYPFTTLAGATISAGQYLTGDQTILQAYTSGISASNIKYGQVVEVGDSANNTRIHNVTGTFTGASTVSSGQTAAGAAQIRSGYSAWVDGDEVQGSIADQAAQTITPTTTNQTIASGKYLSGAQTILGDANLSPENIKNGVSIFGVTGSYTGTAPIVTRTLDSHGGDIVEITTDAEYSWRGPAVEFVQNITGFDVALKDTTFNTWTPSTTNASIKATANSGTYVADMTQYEYIIEWRCWMDYVYVDGTVPKVTPKTQCDVLYCVIARRPDSFASINGNIYNYNYAENFSAFIKNYYNANGAETLTYEGSYGVRAVAQTSALSSNTVDDPTITFKLPSLAARCSTTYMSTAMAAAIDKTNSVYHCRGKLYRCKIGTFSRGKFEAVTKLYQERSGL